LGSALQQWQQQSGWREAFPALNLNHLTQLESFAWRQAIVPQQQQRDLQLMKAVWKAAGT